MAIEISYRHEYLTGFAMGPGLSSMWATVMAVNHGPFEEHVRVVGITLDGHVRFDSGDDVPVAPHRGWCTTFDMFDNGSYGRPAGCRVRILTSSTNLILSVGDPNGQAVRNNPPGEDPPAPFPYYGPNDFAVFTLHAGPPELPPVVPVENA